MKQIILFTIIALCLATSTATAQRFFDISAADTLTNQDTVIQTTSPVQLDVPYYYSIHVLADSLSGANAGTCYLQFSNHRSGSVWYNAQTLTIDGTTTSQALWEGIVYARRVRVYWISPSGTRSVALRTYAAFKRVY